ncbi:MAG: hypothetical protein ACRD4K_03470 [Candidatus Acidiferrales bacterium]
MRKELFKKLLDEMRDSLEGFHSESRRLQGLIEHLGPTISLSEYHSLLSQRVRATYAMERYFSQRQELFKHLRPCLQNQADRPLESPRVDTPQATG